MGLIAANEEGLTAAITQDMSFAVVATWISLHSGDPGTTGVNEVTTGTGAFGRQQATFTGSAGIDTNNADLTFDVPASTTILWIGFWSAQTGGTFQGGFPLISTPQVAVGLMASTTIYCPGHGLAHGDTVRVETIAGLTSSVPGGLVPDGQYSVGTIISADEMTLQPFGGGSDITVTGSRGFSISLDNFLVSGGSTATLVLPAGTGIVYQTAS